MKYIMKISCYTSRPSVEGLQRHGKEKCRQEAGRGQAGGRQGAGRKQAWGRKGAEVAGQAVSGQKEMLHRKELRLARVAKGGGAQWTNSNLKYLRSQDTEDEKINAKNVPFYTVVSNSGL